MDLRISRPFQSAWVLGLTVVVPYWLNATTAIAQVNLPPNPTAGQTQPEVNLLFVNASNGNDKGNGSDRAPFQTITQALRVAQANTVILLAPGTYSTATGEVFPLQLKSKVTIQGDLGGRGQNILIRGGGWFCGNPDNYQFQCTMASQNAAIIGTNQGGLVGVTVINPQPGGYGLWIESGNTLVMNNTFTGNFQNAIAVGGNSNPSIRGNYFYQNGVSGIAITGTSQPEVQDNLLENTGVGITISDRATPKLINNRISANQDGVIISDNALPILRNNIIENNQQDGLVAIAKSLPDMGTSGQPGGNVFRGNRRSDLRTGNPAKTPEVPAITVQPITIQAPAVQPKESSATAVSSQPKEMAATASIMYFGQALPGRNSESAIAPLPNPNPPALAAVNPIPNNNNYPIPAAVTPVATANPIPPKSSLPSIPAAVTPVAATTAIPANSNLPSIAISNPPATSPNPIPTSSLPSIPVNNTPEITTNRTPFRSKYPLVPVKITPVAATNSIPESNLPTVTENPPPVATINPVAASNNLPAVPFPESKPIKNDFGNLPLNLESVPIPLPVSTNPSQSNGTETAANNPIATKPPQTLVTEPIIITPGSPTTARNLSRISRPSTKLPPLEPGAVEIRVPPPDNESQPLPLAANISSANRYAPNIAAPLPAAPPNTSINALNLLPVPNANIPLGNLSRGGNSSHTANSYPSATLRYRVVVEANGDRAQEFVRSLVPSAFLTLVRGQAVMQVGAYSDRANAEEVVQMLSSKGLKVTIEPI